MLIIRLIMLDIILTTILLLEIGALWFQYFHVDLFYSILNDIAFFFRVFCGVVCLFSFGVTSIITMTKGDGEIVRQVVIGK